MTLGKGIAIAAMWAAVGVAAAWAGDENSWSAVEFMALCACIASAIVATRGR